MIKVAQLLERKSGAIFSIEPDEPVLEAIRMMAEHHVGALLVMKGEELAGIVSERDYARKVILLGRSSSETPVWQIMSAPVTCVTSRDTIEECMHQMTERRIRHLPVVENGRVLGVLSIGDLVKALLEEQRAEIDQLRSYIQS